MFLDIDLNRRTGLEPVQERLMTSLRGVRLKSLAAAYFASRIRSHDREGRVEVNSGCA